MSAPGSTREARSLNGVCAQGVFACGLVAFVLLFAMRSEEPRLVSWMIVLVTAVQAGVVITLTSEQFAEAGLLKPWHGNVVYAHIAMLMILLVALVLLLVQGEVPTRQRHPAAAIYLAQKQTVKE